MFYSYQWIIKCLFRSIALFSNTNIITMVMTTFKFNDMIHNFEINKIYSLSRVDFVLNAIQQTAN